MKISKEAENRQAKQAIVLFAFLVVISLLLGSLPALSFGQDAGFELPLNSPASNDSPPAPPSFAAPASIVAAPTDAVAPAAMATPTNFTPLNNPAPAAPKTTAAIADQPPTLPYTPVSAKTNSVVGKEPTAKQLQERPELLRSVGAPDHPFFNYYSAPSDSKSPIQGKPYTVAQLLDGVRDPAARRQLLVAYWELAGLLAEWNMRLDAERRVSAWYNEANTARNPQRTEAFTGAFYIAGQQRKTTEIAFAGKQYQLVERLRSLQGTRVAALSPENYPIPSDYPIAKNYVTYVEKIARSERARYVGRMIPHQAELLEARKNGRAAMDRHFVVMTQNQQAGPQDWISALNQRTDAFVDLIAAVVDYNKSIAEYTAETVGANVSNYRLLGAVLELPRAEATAPQTPQIAAPPRTVSQLGDPLPQPPMAFTPTESAYGRPLDESDAPPSNPFAKKRPQPAPPSPRSAVQPASLAETVPSVANPVQPASFVETAPSDAAPVQPANHIEEQ